MRKIITIAAASLMIAAAIPAQASNDDVSCGQTASGSQLSAQARKVWYASLALMLLSIAVRQTW